MKRGIVITSFVEGKIRQLVGIDEDDYIICADGGLALALAEGIKPDVVIGDFDSLDIQVPNGVSVQRLPVHKDVTDTAAALQYAEERGLDYIVIAGGIGGRLDHTIANIQNIFAALDRGVTVVMVDKGNTVMALRDSSAKIKKLGSCKLSLFSFSQKCLGVTVSGVEYPLKEHTLTADYPLGVSNEFVKDEAFVRVRQGRLLVILSQEA
ncbi:MAG: thiamine diphosphokinase [Clostridiales bacterium]|nr:thiamine diphosphokinase [Clostridiales bacterium]